MCTADFHEFYTLPSRRISSVRAGKYTKPATTKASSKAISPVVSATGPVYHTCDMHGTITLSEHSPAKSAAMPCSAKF